MRRLFFSIILVVIGSIFVIGWGIDRYVAEKAPNAQNEQQIYHDLIDGFVDQLDKVDLSEQHSFAETLSKQFKLGLVVEETSSIALPSSLSPQLNQQGGLLLASDEKSYILRALPNNPNRLLQLTLPIQPEDEHLNIYMTLTLYLGVCLILLLCLLPLARRLYLLTKAAEQMGTGNLSVRVNSNPQSYLYRLEAAFNDMAIQLDKLIADNKILARSLSHDIRTPMSCLRFGIEAAIDTKDPEKREKYLHRIDAELTRMEEMTSAFLDYASMERRGINLRSEWFTIQALIDSVIEGNQQLAEQYNIQLAAELPNQELQVCWDFHWCYRALQNLIGNAIRYASSEVVIKVTANKQCVTINIEDDGQGIAEDKLSTIFTPFVKLDENQGRESGHFGLGLAITAKVVDWHKGCITASNRSNGTGASFTLRLPTKIVST